MTAMDKAKQYAVNWNNHMNHVRKAFDTLLTNCELTDVILYADGQKIGAHKMLLSACSSYFRNLFLELPREHPVIILKGVSYPVLIDILKFIYNGEVSVDSEVFDSFLQTAEFLQINGLTDGSKHSDKKSKRNHNNDNKNSFQVKKPKKVLKKNLRPETNQGDLSTDLNESDSVLNGFYGHDSNEIVKENMDFTPEIILQTSETPLEGIKVKMEEDELPLEEEAIDYKDDEKNPLKCSICAKVFSHPYSLHHHKPVHLGSTKCPICHVVLSRKYNLKMHMRSRHNVAC